VAVSVVFATHNSNVDRKGRDLSWAITPTSALKGLSSSLEKGSPYIENIVEDFMYAKFGPMVLTDAFKSQWFNEMYAIRQHRLTASLAQYSLEYLTALSERAPDSPLFPSDFIFAASKFVDEAANNASYFKARHAVRDSIPLVARMINDDGWAGMVRSEYIDSFRSRYARLEELFGSSRFDRS
jgi:hypothetical protein